MGQTSEDSRGGQQNPESEILQAISEFIANVAEKCCLLERLDMSNCGLSTFPALDVDDVDEDEVEQPALKRRKPHPLMSSKRGLKKNTKK